MMSERSALVGNTGLGKATQPASAFGCGHAADNQRLVRVRLAPASNPKQDGERLGCVSLAEGEYYHQVNPPGKQIPGFQVS